MESFQTEREAMETHDELNSTGVTLFDLVYNATNVTVLPPAVPRPPRNVSRFYPVIATEMVLSIICLSITIFVYSILPEFRNVHGKNLVSLSACLLTTFIFLTLDLLLRSFFSSTVCFAIALVIHVTFLATFFWTNVMAFDIWRTMVNLRPKSEAPKSSSKYQKYAIYAWSATMLTALPAVILDRTDTIPVDYRPNFGVRRCWLSGTRSFLMYFNAPVGVILLCNLTMFALTTWNLIQIRKITERLHAKQQEQRFFLYLKLFFVMGIIWVAEFLPWATGVYQLYALAGILTCLQGILLFIIFVCKKRILKKVCEKLNIRIKGDHVRSGTTLSSRTTSTSHGTVSDTKF